MTLPAAAAASRPLSHAASDRAFYSGVAVVMAITTFIGFAPTFYLRSMFGAPASVTGMVTRFVSILMISYAASGVTNDGVGCGLLD